MTESFKTFKGIVVNPNKPLEKLPGAPDGPDMSVLVNNSG